VPRDLSVVGFDDTPIASVIWPALTTMRQPIAKMTGIALDLIREEVRLRRGGSTWDTTPLVEKHINQARVRFAAAMNCPASSLRAQGSKLLSIWIYWIHLVEQGVRRFFASNTPTVCIAHSF